MQFRVRCGARFSGRAAPLRRPIRANHQIIELRPRRRSQAPRIISSRYRFHLLRRRKFRQRLPFFGQAEYIDRMNGRRADFARPGLPGETVSTTPAPSRTEASSRQEDRSMIKVILADDHAVMRDGLRHILETAGGFEIVGEASDGATTLALAERGAADVLLLDLSMPAPTGIELIRMIKTHAPALRTLVLTMHTEEQYAARAFKAGATGYLTKDSATAELVAAVGKVAAGGLYVSPSAAESLARTLHAPAETLPHERLSAREFDVMRRIVAGQTVTEIAGALALSAKTVSTYKMRILEKMDLPHDAALIRYAVRHGLGIDLDDA